VGRSWAGPPYLFLLDRARYGLLGYKDLQGLTSLLRAPASLYVSTYQSNGLQCRPYTHTIYINGQPQVARGNACRNPDGTWTAVG
jgi:hypothetical protein